MTDVTLKAVQNYFDTEACKGRRLLPDRNNVSGLGTYVKYSQATALMAEVHVINVLDIGCNRGSIEVLFQLTYPEKASKTFVEGIDISNEAIKQATDLGLPNCQFRSYDGFRLPYPSESFDLVVLVEVIEHVVEKEYLLQEIGRVLRPSGKLFLTTPNPECLTLRAESLIWRVLQRLFRKRPAAKDIFISHDELSESLSSLGYQMIQPGRMYFWPHLFIYFLGWSILPPLPPKAIYYYQKLCLKLFTPNTLPEYLERRVMWSLVGLVQKASSSTSEISG